MSPGRVALSYGYRDILRGTVPVPAPFQSGLDSARGKTLAQCPDPIWSDLAAISGKHAVTCRGRSERGYYSRPYLRDYQRPKRRADNNWQALE
jgi:hypothetical protein